MIFTEQPLLIFDLIGFFLTLSSMTIVAHASGAVVGKLRKGLLSLLWGLLLISFSFVWAVVVEWFALTNAPDLRPVIMSFGMALFLISCSHLFKIYRSDRLM